MTFHIYRVSLVFNILCAVSFLLLPFWGRTQVNRGEGLPFIRTFTDADTRARPQNYAFTQDEYGLLYVANQDGVLQFDGMRHSWYLIPTRSACHALTFHKDSEDRKAFVTVGCEEDFGILEIKEKGKLEFRSLAEPLRKKVKQIGKITRVETNGTRYFFMSDRALYWYDRRNDYHLVAKGQFVAMFRFNDKVYVVERDANQNRVHIFDKRQRQDKKTTVDLTSDLPWDTWTGAGNTKGNRLLLSFASRKHPSLVWFEPESGHSQPVSGEINKTVESASCVQRLVDGRWAVGTRFSGVYIFTDEGEVIRRILPGQSGLTLTDPNVRALYNMHDRYLWVSFNGGLIAVDLGRSGLSYFDKSSGVIGSAFQTVLRHQGQLFTGTSRGLFKYIGSADKTFSPVKGTEDLSVIAAAESKGFMYAIVDGTLKRLKGTEMVKAHDAQGFTTLVSGADGVLYAGFDGGVVRIDGPEVDVLVSSAGRVIDVQVVTGWLVYLSYDHTLFIAPLGGGAPSAVALPEGIKSETVIGLHQAYGKILISMNKELWEFTPASRNFRQLKIKIIKPSDVLEPGDFWTLVQADDGQAYGYVTHAEGYSVFRLTKDYKAELIPVLMNRNFKIYSFAAENNILWVGTGDRLIRVDRNAARSLPPHPFKPLVRRMEAREKNSRVYQTHFFGIFRDALGLPSTLQTDDDIVTLSDETREVRLQVAWPLYGKSDGILYKYRLSPDHPWTVTYESTIRLIGLTYQDYNFELKAIDPINGQDSGITSYKFRIKYPWYFDRYQPWLYVFIGFSFVFAYGVFVFLLRYFTRKIEERNRKLEVLVQERTYEIEQANKELEQSKLELEQKNEELEHQKHVLEDRNLVLREANKTIEQQKNKIAEDNKLIIEQRNEIQKLERSRTANMFLPVFAHEFGTALRVMQDATRDTNEKLAVVSTGVAEVAHQLNEADLRGFIDLLKRLPASLQEAPDLDTAAQRRLRRSIEAKLAEWDPDQADRYAQLFVLSGLVGTSIQDEVLELYPKNPRAAEAIRNFAAVSAGGLRAETQSQTAAFKARLFREFFNREFENHLVPLSISLGMARYLLEYQLSQNLRLEFRGFKPMNALKKVNLPDTFEPDFLNATEFRDGDWTGVDRCRVPYRLNQEWVVLILWTIDSIRADKGKDGQFKVRCEEESGGVRVIFEDSRAVPADTSHYQEIFYRGHLPETQDIHQKANFIQLFNARNAFVAGGGTVQVEVLNPEDTGGLTWRTSVYLPEEGKWPSN